MTMKLTLSALMILSLLISGCASNKTNVANELKSDYSGGADRYPAGGGPGEEALQMFISKLALASNRSEATITSYIRSTVSGAENLQKSGYKYSDADQLKIVDAISTTYKDAIAKKFKINSEQVTKIASDAKAGRNSDSAMSSLRSDKAVNDLAEIFATTPKLDPESKDLLTQLNNRLIKANVSPKIRVEAITSAAKAAEAAGRPILKSSCNEIATDALALHNSIEITDRVPANIIEKGLSPGKAVVESIQKEFDVGSEDAITRCKALQEEPCNHFAVCE